jgi:hypothetical protein
MFSEEPDIVTSEDLDLWLKLAWQVFCFRFADEILGEYYVHENSASNSIIRHMSSKFAVLNKHFSNAGGNTLWNRIRRRKTKALIYYGAARNYQQNRQRKNALSFFRKSLSAFPLFLRAYAGIVLTIVSRPSA